MRIWLALLLLALHGLGFAQAPAVAGPVAAETREAARAYPEADTAAAWRGLAASYIRQAERDDTLDRDPVLNARVDRVMAAVGAAVALIDARFSSATWRAILINRFGHGAVAFPGQIVIVDAQFVRVLKLNDDELALLLSHEAAHVIANHASSKLSFMAEFLGKDRIPTARSALLEFLAKDSYAAVYRPTARMQEREADAVGAAIFFATGFDARRALWLFDKLAAAEAAGGTQDAHGAHEDSHDTAALRKKAVSTVIAELQQAESGSASLAR